MLKLYFKKLASMLFYWLFCEIVYIVAFNLLYSVSDIFKNPIIDTFIFPDVLLMLSAIIVYIRRTRNDKMRRTYLKETESLTHTFKNEFKYMIGFFDFRAEIFSFVTIFLFPFIASVLTSRTRWYNALMMVVMIALFIIFDLGLWMLVHRAWCKDEIWGN